jgi:glycosyltransferase involved in cell wall biosynthesis
VAEGPALAGGVLKAGGTRRALRVLVVAHAHPAWSTGGSELAAWRLYQALKQTRDVAAWLVAGGGSEVPDGAEGCFQQPFGADEYVYRAGDFDAFLQFNRTPGFAADWAALLQRLRPDVIHLHHTINLGVEALLAARRALPQVRLLLTLHDFGAICHNYGQMVTRPDRVLCSESSPTACHRCFAERPAEEFLLRQRVLLRFLKLVDGFVAPSRFVAERYIRWGLPRALVSVIENIIPPPARLPPLAAQCHAATRAHPLRCGYFGQLTPFKGIGLLLEAGRLLARRGLAVEFEIHGDDANHTGEIREEVRALRLDVPAGVSFHGAYPNHRVHALMRAVDVVVVPSLWWENAPTVIEEALQAGRPVVCGDIGGMAEKVRDGIDGLHFTAGSSSSLADTIAVLAENPDLRARLAGSLRRPTTPERVLARHLALYRRGRRYAL